MGHHQANQCTHCVSLRKRMKEAEKIFEKIVAENFPNLMKYINIQEAQVR